MPLEKESREIVDIVIVAPWQASEAVENFLLELGALGASIEKFDLEGSTETVHGYFPGDTPIGELKASVHDYLKAIEPYSPSPARWQVSVCILTDKDWQEAWKVFFKTIRVTRRIIIKPTWTPYAPRKGETVIEIDPGMAFGTGLHPTTRLCLQMIDREVDRRIRGGGGQMGKEFSVLDVGTGTGILAIAAAKLGARPVMGIDIDETAIEVACQNVKRNRVKGSVRISSENLEAVDRCFDLVIANIDLRTLADLSRPLAAHVSDEGRMVLSGILREQKENLGEIFRAEGFCPIKEKHSKEWICLVCERS